MIGYGPSSSAQAMGATLLTIDDEHLWGRDEILEPLGQRAEPCLRLGSQDHTLLAKQARQRRFPSYKHPSCNIEGLP